MIESLNVSLLLRRNVIVRGGVSDRLGEKKSGT